MNILVFLTTFILICDYAQIRYFLLQLLSPSVKKYELSDKDILALIKDKAGLSLKKITIIESDKMFGGMSGTPNMPKMYLSSELKRQLTIGELEYVLLHELAHHKYYHPIITLLAQFILMIIGTTLASFTNPIEAFIIGVILAILFILLARYNERVAENFAAKNMESPQAMITAVNKFEQNWKGGLFGRLTKLISWNISYNEKRKIATNYISS